MGLLFKKIDMGDMKGWVREDLIDFLPPDFFRDPVLSIKEAGGKVVAESKWRWAGFFTPSPGRGVFLKRDRTKGPRETLKYLLFPSKGRKEWFIAYQLGKRNLNIPKPLGWVERVHRVWVKESYYLSEAIESGVSLAEIAGLLKDEKISAELVKTVIRMHASGLLHQDLHAGNLLWDGESFFLIDLHRTRLLRSLSLSQRLWNLSHLFHSLRSVWGEKEHLRFLDQYFGEDSLPSKKREECLRKIHFKMDRLQKRQWKSRTKRCMKESTEFSVKREGRSITYHRKDFPLDRLKKVIASHLASVQEKPSALLKNSPEVKISLVEDEESRVCVKQFCYPSFWERFKDHFRLSKGLKAWFGGNGLKARGLPSIKLLALMEKKHWFKLTESYLIMEVSETGEEMDRYICKGFNGFEEKRSFIKHFALWLAQLHQKDLCHKDMKTCNLLVSGNGETRDIYLLDFEDVLVDEKINEKRLFKNFLQLNTSTPRIVTLTDRLRFLKAYQKQHPVIKNEKLFLRRLVQKSNARGIAYVSSRGVIEEKL